MKKLLALSACALAFTATPAVAGDGKGRDHHKDKMFEKHDTNGDGVISKAEYMDHVEKRFSDMDADGDGDVTKEEAKAAHEKMREKWEERKERYKEKRGDSSED